MLQISGVELTQAIQYFGSTYPVCGTPGAPAVCGDNSLPLVAGKALGVRVFYRGASPGVPVTGAAVKVLPDGMISPTSFPARKDLIDVPWPPTRGNSEHSVNLLVPPQEATGTWKLSVSLFEKLASGVGQFTQQVVDLQFVERARVAIRLVRIHYQGERDGRRYDLAAPTLAEFWQMADFALRILPIPGICIARESVEVCDATFRNNFDTSDPLESGSTGTVFRILQRLRAVEALAPEVIYVGFYPEGASGTGGGVSWGPTMMAPNVVPQLFAHELAHSHGLWLHAPSPTVMSGAASTADTSFPRYGALPWGSIGEVGFDPLTQNAVAPERFDVLSYDEPRWISPHYYRRIFDWVGLPRAGRCGQIPGPAGTSAPPPIPFPGHRQRYFDCYYVEGLPGGFDQRFCGPKIPWPQLLPPWPKGPLPQEGPVRAFLFDKLGKTIFSGSFDLAHLSETVEDRAPAGFVIRLPELDDAARLRVTLGERVIEDSELDRKPVALVAKAWLIKEPRPKVRVEWSVDDDAAGLPVFVRASCDHGASWTAFNVPGGAQRLDVDIDAMPPGDHCIVELLAGARLRTTTWRSDPLPVRTGREQLLVLEPRERTLVDYGQPVRLWAIRLHGGHAEDLAWYSDRDGALGSGEHLLVTLSVGRHRLSVRSAGSDLTEEVGEVRVQKPKLPARLR